MEQKAFEEIYRLYSNDLYRFILRMTCDEQLAQDILQDTMLRAVMSIDSFRGDCELKTWLCTIARNEYRSWLKKNADKTLSISEISEQPAPDNIVELVEQRDVIAQIHRLLHRLDEPYKEVFMLRVFAELRYSEIAKIFGKTESWAGVTFFRAKKQIIHMMEEENGNEIL